MPYLFADYFLHFLPPPDPRYHSDARKIETIRALCERLSLMRLSSTFCCVEPTRYYSAPGARCREDAFMFDHPRTRSAAAMMAHVPASIHVERRRGGGESDARHYTALLMAT